MTVSREYILGRGVWSFNTFHLSYIYIHTHTCTDEHLHTYTLSRYHTCPSAGVKEIHRHLFEEFCYPDVIEFFFRNYPIIPWDAMMKMTQSLLTWSF